MAGVDAAIRRWHLKPPIEEVCELGRRAHRRYGSRRWT